MNRILPGDPEANSLDLAAENAKRLRSLFPEAFTEGKIDFEILKSLLGDTADDAEEKYGLHWHGKSRARQLALKPSSGTLRPCAENSLEWDSTRNLLLEGENLEVLKLLQKSYSGWARLIYIDPPYNTGKENEYLRAILTQLSLRYLIPVIDMAVLVNSEEGRLHDAVGRVTTLMLGEACLLCRGRIDPKRIMYEMLLEQERERQAGLGNAPELRTRNPAVIPFTTVVAAAAVGVLLHRLTGFMGADRVSTETIHRFHQSKVSSNRQPCGEHCLCSDKELWGSGDTDEPYLGMFG